MQIGRKYGVQDHQAKPKQRLCLWQNQKYLGMVYQYKEYHCRCDKAKPFKNRKKIISAEIYAEESYFGVSKMYICVQGEQPQHRHEHIRRKSSCDKEQGSENINK